MHGMIRTLNEKLVGFIVHLDVGRFNRYHQIVISEIFDDLKVFQSRFSQPFRCYSAELLYYVLFKGARVHSYPDWHGSL